MEKVNSRASTPLSHAAAILALLLFLLTFSIYCLESTIIYRLCGNFLYSGLHSICTEANGDLLHLSKFVFFGIALLLALFVLFSAKRNRKRFITFLKFFAPASIIILLLSYFAEFCFMYSCSNILPLGMRSVIFIGVLGLLVLLSCSLFNGREYLSVVLVFFFIMAAGLVVHYSNLFALQDKTMQKILNNPNSAKDCYRARFISEQDKCLFSEGVSDSSRETCSSVQDSNLRANCVAYIIRNRAVTDLNVLACDQITVPVQKEVCTSLIAERIRLKKGTSSSPE